MSLPPLPSEHPPASATLPAPVLIVEDDPLFQRRLRAVLLQLGYTADALVCAASLTEARACLDAQPVGLALLDLQLPDGYGCDLIAPLRAQNPGLAILVVTAWSAQETILSALRAGATGYVLKERDDFEVMLSIRSALRGGAPIDPFIARRILELLPSACAPALPVLAPAAVPAPPRAEDPSALATGEALSERERGILQLVSLGHSNREIAEQLFLSPYTVESYIKRIYRKLEVSSRAMAVRTALQRGDIS